MAFFWGLFTGLAGFEALLPFVPCFFDLSFFNGLPGLFDLVCILDLAGLTV